MTHHGRNGAFSGRFCGETRATCAHCLARHPAAGGALSAEEVAEIHLERSRIRLPARRRLAAKAGTGAALINLTAGVVKISPKRVRGVAGGADDAGVGVVFAPDIVSPQDGAITALADCEMCCFSSAGLRRLFARHPRLQERFLRHSLESLHRAREQAALLNRPRAMERVAALFWSCARAAETRGERGGEIAMPMRGVEMAALLGLSKETVSRCVSALRADGHLRPLDRTRFVVPDMHALRALCGG